MSRPDPSQGKLAGPARAWSRPATTHYRLRTVVGLSTQGAGNDTCRANVVQCSDHGRMWDAREHDWRLRSKLTQFLGVIWM